MKKWLPRWIHYASISFISAKTRSSALTRLIYALLKVAMLVGLLMAVKNPGKVQNRRVAKSRIVLLILIIILILDKTFIP